MLPKTHNYSMCFPGEQAQSGYQEEVVKFNQELNANYPMSNEIVLNDRYQLEESLGTGGMAVVYRAQDRMLERAVAIKILREDFSDDPDFQERFRQEAKAAANLSHPNIVTVHDFGLDRGRLFIVLEHVPGTNLKQDLQRRGRLDEEEAISLMIQACAGVGYAHREGLIHCDIKPHNLLITPDNRLKVTDFGIARALATIQPEEKSEVVWGSPQYFSPEQAAGQAPSPASDVYSLGVILYEMLTGQLPFVADSATELARLHREALAPSPRDYNPAISPSLERIILKVLSKEPSARYRTADHLGRVLVTYSQETPQIEPIAYPTGGTAITAPVSAVPNENLIEPNAAQANETFYSSPPQPKEAKPIAYPTNERNPLELDWITISLGLLALLAVGGLVPLYLWIYFLYFQ